MHEGTHCVWWLAGGALAGYILLMSSNPARPSLRDGLRCVRRYPQVWLWPAGFALAHAGFRLWRHVYESWIIPNAPPTLVPWGGWQPSPWGDAVAASWLPAMESTSTIFNCVVTAFPLSAVAALLFLGNWRGYQTALHRSLRRRCGVAGGAAIGVGLVVSAAAAVCKPMLFGSLPRLNGYLGEASLLRLGEAVDSLSFVFENPFGVGVEIYVILLCFAWVRGLTFDFDGLRRFALRRFTFVVKWAVVVIMISGLGISVPLIASSFIPPSDASIPDWTGGTIQATRWLLSVTLLLFSSMQILLIFHNESLLQACADHFRILRRHGAHVGWFVSIVALHFFALALADAVLPAAVGLWTWPGVTWSLLVYPMLWTALAGWFLASWVCLFRRCERNAPDLDEMVRF